MSGKLDMTVSPGEKTVLKWQKRVAKALSHNPEFVTFGKRGRCSIWECSTIGVPVKKRKVKQRSAKDNFMGHGRSMGTGSH